MLDFPAWPASPAGTAALAAAALLAGGLVGSFLNVVVHRVPRGETVVRGRSRCPACGATIRARDNVPVLGWLMLRGRCRDCGTAISARYPLVEAACGGLAAALALVEVAWAPPGDQQAAVVAWCGRTTLALTCVAWCLLADGGHVVRRTTVFLAATSATLAAAILPPLRPLPVGCAGAAWCSPAGWADHLVASVVGLATGCLAGRAAGSGPEWAVCALVGAALGWQAAVLAALAAVAGRTLVRHPSAGSLTAVAATLGWHPLAAAWGAVCRRWGGE